MRLWGKYVNEDMHNLLGQQMQCTEWSMLHLHAHISGVLSLMLGNFDSHGISFSVSIEVV